MLGFAHQLFEAINTARLDMLVVHRREIRSALVDVLLERCGEDLDAAAGAFVAFLVHDLHVPKLFGVDDFPRVLVACAIHQIHFRCVLNRW